jgi:hypothetical protein
MVTLHWKIILLAAALPYACYTPDYGSGGFACGTEESCPSGFSCQLDQCVREGSDPAGDTGAVRVEITVADHEHCATEPPEKKYDCEETLIVMASNDKVPSQDDKNTTINLVNLASGPKIVEIPDLEPGDYYILAGLYEEGFTKWSLSENDLRAASDSPLHLEAGHLEVFAMQLERGGGPLP